MADTGVKQKIIDAIKDSSNVLVTVNSNPSVDELSAALGITLLINKLDKHATAVFSGAIPAAIEFLEPEKTFENTVNSLRDFIIALDKEKADHLRYKVVGDMVKIFITPYRTTIDESDLDFSQGDYNVETVLAIGVKTEADLDRALESHGRILHDATVAAISVDEPSNLGGIEWVDAKASSYSEMLVSLADGLKSGKNLLDEQIATAFLTGIVAATDRFSNNKTSAASMTVAAQLMAAGANQQLIATKLEETDQITASDNRPSSHGELRENQPAKVNRGDDGGGAQPVKQQTDGNGSLSISHVPHGDVDEVAAQVATENSEDAAVRAEQRLAEQLAQAPRPLPLPVMPLPTPQPASQPSPQPVVSPMHGAVSTDQWRGHANIEASEPSFGGTLNATTEQAEEDKRQEIAADRNRTLLNHGSGGYAAGAPAYQPPLNAAMDTTPQEPSVQDIFADQPLMSDSRSHLDAIQPPAPAQTLADIDAQHRDHGDAMNAVNAAFGAPAPSMPPMPMPGQPASAPASDLPPLPPLPDFSSLPPLPGAPAPQPVDELSVPDALGAILPPAPAPQQPIGSASASTDPAQFKIPGQ